MKTIDININSSSRSFIESLCAKISLAINNSILTAWLLVASLIIPTNLSAQSELRTNDFFASYLPYLNGPVKSVILKFKVNGKYEAHREYHFDKAKNLTSVIHYLVDSPEIEYYFRMAYNEENQLLEERILKFDGTVFGVLEYEYDKDGYINCVERYSKSDQRSMDEYQYNTDRTVRTILYYDPFDNVSMVHVDQLDDKKNILKRMLKFGIDSPVVSTIYYGYDKDENQIMKKESGPNNEMQDSIQYEYNNKRLNEKTRFNPERKIYESQLFVLNNHGQVIQMNSVGKNGKKNRDMIMDNTYDKHKNWVRRQTNSLGGNLDIRRVIEYY